jgi:hypothetical protein
MTINDEIRAYLSANPRLAIEFAIANQEEFLEFINKKEDEENFEQVLLAEGEEPEPTLPETIQELEKAYAEAEDINITSYLRVSRMNDVKTIHKDDFIDKLARAITDGTLSKEYTKDLFTRIGA